MVALLDVVERGAEPDRVGDAGRTGLESRWALGKADGKLEPRVKDREDARAWRCRFSGIRCPVASHAILIGAVEAPVLARDVHAVPVHRARVTTIRVSFGRERQRAAERRALPHAFYQWIRARRGHEIALVAAARKLAVLFWCLLTAASPTPTNSRH